MEPLPIVKNILKAHSQYIRAWSDEEIDRYVNWYKDMGLLLFAADPEITETGMGRDVSFSLIRLLPDIQSRLRPYFSDPSGHIVYVDYVYAGSKRGMMAICLEGYKRYKDQARFLAWHREHKEPDTYSLVHVRCFLKYYKGLFRCQ